MEARALFQPLLDIWMGMRAVVVENQVEIEPLWGISVNLSEFVVDDSP